MKIQNELELKNLNQRSNLKKISADEVEVISVDAIWDGPLGGVCQWNNQRYYFQCFDLIDDEEESRWPRKYLLINLTAKQIDNNAKLHDMFLRWRDSLISKEEYQSYLQSVPSERIDIDQIVGWFDSDFKDSNQPVKFIKSYLVWQKEHGESSLLNKEPSIN
jgi:hypothetical protein